MCGLAAGAIECEASVEGHLGFNRLSFTKKSELGSYYETRAVGQMRVDSVSQAAYRRWPPHGFIIVNLIRSFSAL